MSSTFVVQQGLYSPRDKTVGWRHWSEHETLPEAQHEARRLGWARIIQQRLIHVYEDGKLQTERGRRARERSERAEILAKLEEAEED